MHAPLCCERIEVGLPEYLDGAQATDMRLRFESHLVVCQECWRELHRLQHVRMLLRGLPGTTMPEPMKSTVLRQFARPHPTRRVAIRP